MLRFHLDENVRADIAVGLRARGIDCTTSSEAGLLGAPDVTQLAYSARSGRVVVSHDADMLRLAASGVEHGGIVWSAMHSRQVGQIVMALVYLSRNRSSEEMRNWIEFL